MDDDDAYVQSFVQADDAALMAAIAARDAQVMPLLKPGGNPASALSLSLADPPYQTRTPEVKSASFEVVCKALVAIKEAEIAGAVEKLSLDECDVLMKYLYLGLGPAGKKNETYTMLLKWHPVVLKRAGPGSVTRAISEVSRAL